MILAESQIKSVVQSGHVTVTPTPDDVQYQPASLDLRIGERVYNPATGEYENGVELPPHAFKITHTMEKISLPNDTAAFVTGRSSVGRQGCTVHLTAGWIDPGFTGQIVLEMVNVGPDILTFDPGERVCQIMFMPVLGETDGYRGQYQHQEGPRV